MSDQERLLDPATGPGVGVIEATDQSTDVDELLWTDDSGDDLEGFVLLRIGNTWYSQADIIEEKTVFVSPKFRSAKGGRARKLCEFSKKVADELGLPLLIGILSNQRTKGKVEMYKRVFGDPAGAFFLYGAHTGAWNRDSQTGLVGEK